MKIDIKIPAVGESITEAIIATILKPSGSLVKEGEEILELETDKVNQVVYAPKSGKLTLTVTKDQKVKIGDVIGSIDTDVTQISPEKLSPTVSSISKEQIPPAALPKPAPQESEIKPVKPTQIAGATRKKMSSLRQKIASRLVEVKNTTAMLTTFNEADLSKVIEIRTREQAAFQKKYGVKLGFMSFFVKAVVLALQEIPQVNSMIDGEDILTFSTYDIGVAVSTDKGLMVPVIRGCDKKSLGQIEQEIAAFAQKAREGKMAIDDLRGGSFTITNGGTFGSLLSTPIMNPPQSAILGMHAITKRAVVIDDQIVIRPMMYTALSYDHRLIDGKEAVQFLMNLKQSLEDPARLLVEL